MALNVSLPDGWIWTTLDEACHIILGQSPSSDTYNTEGIGLPFYQGKTEFGEFYPTTVKWCSAPGKIAEAGDVLISVRAPVGPTNLCEEKSCIGRGLAALRPKGGMPNKYILYYLRLIEKEWDSKATGTTFKAITGDILRQQEMPLAPISEQERIVARIESLFTQLDAGVAGLKRVQAALKRYKASVLKAACEGRLVPQDPSDEPAEELLHRLGVSPLEGINLPFLPEGWCWTRVGDLSKKIQYGTSEKANLDISGIPVLRMGNIQDGKLNFDNLKYLPNDTSGLTDLILEDGDLIFNRTNSAELVGKTAVYKKNHPKATFASYLIRVKFSSNYSPDYISFYINSLLGRKYISSVVSQQVGQANVNGTKLANMPIPLPPVREQTLIVAEVEKRLSVVQELEQAVSANLQRAERLRQAILKRAFEGRLVEQDSNDDPASVPLNQIRKSAKEGAVQLKMDFVK
jgi:type I restriction enzyme S subunit